MAAELRAEVNGTTLAYREQGTGPLALFVHGYPFDGTMWLDQLGALARLRHCVAVDLRGFGGSAALVEEVLTMERLADDLAALAHHFGERADIIALSMGGYAALALWELHPEVIRSLVLASTRAEPDTEQGRADRDAMADQTVERGTGWLADTMIPRLLAETSSLFARARVRSMIERTRCETVVAALRGMRDRADRRTVLNSIDVPTLVLAGTEDQLIFRGCSRDGRAHSGIGHGGGARGRPSLPGRAASGRQPGVVGVPGRLVGDGDPWVVHLTLHRLAGRVYHPPHPADALAVGLTRRGVA